VKVSRILHAGYVFESGPTQILFDPIFENPFSRNCFAFPSVRFDYDQIKNLKPDAIFISHYHDDHCSFESLQHLNFETPVYLYCLHDELFDLLRELGFKNVYHLYTNVPVKVGAFEVTSRLALDSDVDSIFQISAEGLNVLNVVDAWIDPSAMQKLTQTSWDLILWPFQTMRETEVIAPELALPPELPEEWLQQIKDLGPRYVVPSSCQFIQEEWSWYRKAYFPISYNFFEAAVKQKVPGTFVKRLNPGTSFELSPDNLISALPLSWLLPEGSQELDYEFDPDQKVPDTQEVARYFFAATDGQRRRVADFCKNDLIQKYQKVSSGVTGYWRLSLYDQSGADLSFCYRVEESEIILLDESPEYKWVTEVPLIKVYAALEEGEQLSSMYVQMRGIPLDNIFEDPLVATLFSGDIFSYQRHQLKKIRGQL